MEKLDVEHMKKHFESLKIEKLNLAPDKETALNRLEMDPSRSTNNQKIQFNLGNSIYNNNALKAAEILLEREYRDTFLFEDEGKKSIIIPPIFVSILHKSDVAVLDYDIKKALKERADIYDKSDDETQKQLAKEIFFILPENQEDEIRINDFMNLKTQLKKNYKDDPLVKFLRNLNLADVSGEKTERWLYDELKKVLELPDQENVVLIHSSNVEFKKGKQKQYDFMLFLPSCKLIIGIECKHTLYDEKVFKQLKDHKELYEKHFGDIFNSEWNYCPVVAVYKPTEEMVRIFRENNHFIHPEKDIKDWFKQVILSVKDENLEIRSIKDWIGTLQLKRMLEIIVFCLQMSNKVMENGPYGLVHHFNLSTYIESAIKTVATKDNIIFYSRTQLPLFLDKSFKKTVLFGGFGSGKTLLMHKKAEELAQNGEKVLFIFGGVKKTLLQRKMEEDWEKEDKCEQCKREGSNEQQERQKCKRCEEVIEKEKYKENIEIMNKEDIVAKTGFNSTDALVKKLKDTKRHIFMDEWNSKMSLEKFKDFDTDKFVWIAFNAPGGIVLNMTGSKKLGDFKSFKLGNTMRNSKGIIAHYCKDNVDPSSARNPVSIPLHNFPDGTPPVEFDTIKEAMEKFRFTNEILILPLLEHIKDSEKPNIIKEVFEAVSGVVAQNSKVYVYSSLNGNLDDSDIHKADEENCLSYLREGILISDREMVEGFEWPNVVVYYVTGSEDDDRNDIISETNLGMRCTLRLVIVKDKRV